MFRENVCPSCKTVISAEQKKALKAQHKRGGIVGLVFGLIGAALGITFGLYGAMAG